MTDVALDLCAGAGGLSLGLQRGGVMAYASRTAWSHYAREGGVCAPATHAAHARWRRVRTAFHLRDAAGLLARALRSLHDSDAMAIPRVGWLLSNAECSADAALRHATLATIPEGMTLEEWWDADG